MENNSLEKDNFNNISTLNPSINNVTNPPKSNGLLYLLSFTTILASIIAAFFFWQNQRIVKSFEKKLSVNATPAPSPSPSPSTNLTNNWLVYKNEKGGYSIKYPSALKEPTHHNYPYDIELITHVPMSGADENGEKEYSVIGLGTIQRQVYTNLVNSSYTTKIETEKIGNYTAERYLMQQGSTNNLVYIIQVDDKYFRLIVTGYAENLYEKELEDTVKNMLSTLTFSDSTSPSDTGLTGWNKYNIPELGISLQLPSLLDPKTITAKETPSEKGKVLCFNFVKKVTFSFVKDANAGGVGCTVDAFVIGGTTVDFEAGRGGMFTDLQGYISKGGKYYAKQNLGREVEIDNSLVKEIINKNDVKILIVTGKNEGAENFPVTGTPGEGNIGALVNLTSNPNYRGFAIEAPLNSYMNKELFTNILSTIQYSK